ncbi:MAG: CHAT domain-containing protein, partial [Anaerolineae bacterium]
MPPEPVAPCRLRILTLVARPLDQRDLPDVADAWSLVDGLQQVQAPVYLGFVRPPTEAQLRLRLAEAWDVFHFDGHGNPEALALEEEDGTTYRLPTAALVRLFRQGNRLPRLVVLSACESEALGRELTRQGIPWVVAMRRPVDVGTTMAFVRPFYAYLAQGLSPRRAFAAARDGLARGEQDIPVLLQGRLVRDRPLCSAEGPAGEPQVEREHLDGLPGIGDHGFFYGAFTGPGEEPPGRKALLRALGEWFAGAVSRPKLVVLCGEGGIGKTALARAAARRLAWAFGGRVFYVDGAPHQAAGGLRLGHVLAPFGEVLGLDFAKKGLAEQRAEVLAWLRAPGRCALLVVDNADGAEEEVWRFLGDLPEPSAALVTHRAVPKAGRPLRVPPLRPDEGLDFFRRAVAVKGGRFPRRLEDVETEEEKKEHRALWGHAHAIAQALGGHPLALLLAAALWTTEGPAYARRQVEAHPSHGLEDRFDFAWAGLGSEQQGWLVQAAAFAGGMGARTFARASGMGQEEADEALRDLARRAWLSREREGWYRMHPVVRDYVRHKAEPAALAAAERGFAQAFLGLAGAFQGLLGDVARAREAVAFAQAERANLLRGQEVLWERGDWEGAVAYAYHLGDLLERTGDWGDRRRALERGLDAARRAGAQQDVAGLAHNLGVLAQ